MSHYILGCPLPSDFPSVDRRPLLRMASRGDSSGPRGSRSDSCRIADAALSKIEDTYHDYLPKIDIYKCVLRTDTARCASLASVVDHHGSSGCQHCLGMWAFCQLHTTDPTDTRPDLVEVVCDKARKALPSAYGHLVLGLVFSGVAGLRSMSAEDRQFFLLRSISHLQHCVHLHIGCLYLGQAYAKVGSREGAFNAFQKGTKLGIQVLCVRASAECYKTGFGVEQDHLRSQKIAKAVEKDGPTVKDVFYKEWEKNVKVIKENVVEWLKVWVKEGPTLQAMPGGKSQHKAGSNVLPLSPSVVETLAGTHPQDFGCSLCVICHIPSRAACSCVATSFARHPSPSLGEGG